jgi:NAD(P)-dependent dehydrogenase (short-subunit alcohol dehydrogenase family)
MQSARPRFEEAQLMSRHGKRALVTGSTSGIGRATAEALARDGATVIVTDRDPSRGDEVVAAITARGGDARFIPADLHSAADIARLADDAGDVDILVNNAGAFPFGPTHEVEEQTFDATFDINVKAPFFLTGKLAPRMAANGGCCAPSWTATAERRDRGTSPCASSQVTRRR